MAKVGYARVSSVGQSLDVQREKLSGCDKLFEEKRSGTTDARKILPFSDTAQIAVLAKDTSSPIKTFMSLSFYS